MVIQGRQDEMVVICIIFQIAGCPGIQISILFDDLFLWGGISWNFRAVLWWWIYYANPSEATNSNVFIHGGQSLELLSKNIYSYAFSYRDLEQIDPILNFPLPAEDLELVVLHSVKLWRIMNNDSHLKLFYSILPILFDFLLQNGFWEIFTFEHGCNSCS